MSTISASILTRQAISAVKCKICCWEATVSMTWTQHCTMDSRYFTTYSSASAISLPASGFYFPLADARHSQFDWGKGGRIVTTFKASPIALRLIFGIPPSSNVWRSVGEKVSFIGDPTQSNVYCKHSQQRNYLYTVRHPLCHEVLICFRILSSTNWAAK